MLEAKELKKKAEALEREQRKLERERKKKEAAECKERRAREREEKKKEKEEAARKKREEAIKKKVEAAKRKEEASKRKEEVKRRKAPTCSTTAKTGKRPHAGTGGTATNELFTNQCSGDATESMDEPRPKRVRFAESEEIDTNQCSMCFCAYEEDEGESDWVECACGRWIHEDCIEECVVGCIGKERICPICLAV